MGSGPPILGLGNLLFGDAFIEMEFALWLFIDLDCCGQVGVAWGGHPHPAAPTLSGWVLLVRRRVCSLSPLWAAALRAPVPLGSRSAFCPGPGPPALPAPCRCPHGSLWAGTGSPCRGIPLADPNHTLLRWPSAHLAAARRTGWERRRQQQRGPPRAPRAPTPNRRGSPLLQPQHLRDCVGGGLGESGRPAPSREPWPDPTPLGLQALHSPRPPGSRVLLAGPRVSSEDAPQAGATARSLPSGPGGGGRPRGAPAAGGGGQARGGDRLAPPLRASGPPGASGGGCDALSTTLDLNRAPEKNEETPTIGRSASNHSGDFQRSAAKTAKRWGVRSTGKGVKETGQCEARAGSSPRGDLGDGAGSLRLPPGSVFESPRALPGHQLPTCWGPPVRWRSIPE